MRLFLLPLAMMLAGLSAPSLAQDGSRPGHAIGTDITFSTDSDDTSVVRVGANLDWLHAGPEDYLGVRLERVWYRTDGDAARNDERIYLRAAGSLAEGWQYQLNAGTDFHTLLGSGSVHDNSPWRKELFVEREKVETAQGVRRPIISTFGGAAIDMPLGDNAQLTLLGGVQEFTGDNLRVHARANAIYVVKPDWGLSVQLRTRYWHNSDPNEFDYYSPRWYAQLLPVIQMRRTTDSGWRWLIAGGLGAERDSRSDWRQSRFLNLRFSSPASTAGWAVTGEALYSNTPVGNSQSYDYGRFSLGITRAF